MSICKDCDARLKREKRAKMAPGAYAASLREYRKEWGAEKVAASNKKWAVANPVRHREIQNRATRLWRKRNPKSQRCLKNPDFRIKERLASRIREALKRGGKKAAKTRELLGCSIPEFRFWLELDFRSGMTWENYGKFWHIDHIVPCDAFDLTDPEQQKICFHHTNLQALTATENVAKGTKIWPV